VPANRDIRTPSEYCIALHTRADIGDLPMMPVMQPTKRADRPRLHEPVQWARRSQSWRPTYLRLPLPTDPCASDRLLVVGLRWAPV